MGVKYNPFAGNLDIVDSPSGDFSDIEISGDLTLGTGTPVTTVQAVTPTANRTISFPDQSGTVALVAGATGAIQYNESGAQTGTVDFAVDPDWNNASTTFTGLKLNVTDTASAADSKLVDIQSNGTSKVVVDDDGNVGIGTTSPGQKLTVANSDASITAIQIANSATGTTATDGLELKVDANGFAYITNYENTKLFVGTNNSIGLTLDTSNNMGIGTTSPSAKLHVSGSASLNTSAISAAALSIGPDSGAGGTPVLAFTSANTSNQRIDFGDPQASSIGRITYSHATNSLTLRTNGADALTIKSNGTINFSSVSVYADNTAALAGGLVAGDVYRTSTGQLMITY